MPNKYIEFETGKGLEDSKGIGVTFNYISEYFSSGKRKEWSPGKDTYISRKLRYRTDPNGGLGKLGSITVIGASGAMGSEILKRILLDEVLPACEKIQLFGRQTHPSQGRNRNYYNAMIEKLKDGMGGVLPHIEFVDSYNRVDGELLIMCAGKTISKDGGGVSDRTTLVRKNRTIFEDCARSIKENPFNPPKLVIVVSNPNELSTSIFSRYFKRVVAVGPVLDSLRFQREIREELNLSAEIPVHALVGGVHELKGMVLYKSLLRIDGKRPPGRLAERIFSPSMEVPDIREIYKKAYEIVQRGDEGVFDYINTYSILVRLAVKPLIEYYCGGRADFPVGVAVISIIKAFQSNVRSLTTLTKLTCVCDDEVCIGVPLFISNNGVEEIDLDSIEGFRGCGDQEYLLKAVKMLKG